MLNSKLVAMCICPALLVPPAVLAVHKPARHATARLLHRAAARLDPAPAPSAVIAPPCTPTFASSADASGPSGLDAPVNLGPFGSSAAGVPAGLSATAGASDTFASFGGSGGGGGSLQGVLAPPVSNLPGITPDTGTTGPVSGVPEPESWALMIIGFGLSGSALRWRGAAPRQGVTDRPGSANAVSRVDAA